MRLNAREASGLALVVLGLVLIPTAWAFSRTLTVIAFILFGVGGALFYTERIQKRDERLAKESVGSGTCHGTPMPADVHNYTGWRTGGRRADENDGGDSD